MSDKAVKKNEKITSAALKCFKQYGYSKTTFGDIAKKAGVSRALIYSHFKNKGDIFLNLNKKLQDRYLFESESILETDESNSEKLSKIINIWIIDSYRGIKNNVYGNDLLDGLVNISEPSEKRFRRLFIKAIEPLVEKSIAEIIVLSIRGLMDDRPPVKTLQKRIELLIKAITQANL
jgi:TetR/AcrR family transcriptional regulator, transcriptional repressor of aconitase